MFLELFWQLHAHFGWAILLGIAVSVWTQNTHWSGLAWTPLAAIAFWQLNTIGAAFFDLPNIGEAILLGSGAALLLGKLEPRDTPFWAWLYVITLLLMEGAAKATGISVNPYPPPPCEGCIHIMYGYVERIWVGTELGWIAFSAFLLWSIGFSQWYRSTHPANQRRTQAAFILLVFHTSWMITKGIITSGDEVAGAEGRHLFLYVAVLAVSAAMLGLTLMRGTWALRAFAIALLLLAALYLLSGGLYRTSW